MTLSWNQPKDAVENDVLPEIEPQFLRTVHSLLTISTEPSGSLCIYRISLEEVHKPKEMISERILNKRKYVLLQTRALYATVTKLGLLAPHFSDSSHV
jgi:hypothetical protein